MSKKNRSTTSSTSRPSRGSDKVIRVVFGPGGGRVDAGMSGVADGSGRPGPGASGDVLATAKRCEPVADVFTVREASRLLGLSGKQLRSLDRSGAVRRTGAMQGRSAYTFADLIALRAARDLLSSGVRLRDVGLAVDKLRDLLPKHTRPLSELRVVSDGRSVIVKATDRPFEPITGQLVLDFELKQLQEDVVRVLRPASGRQRSRTAFDTYLEACRLDESPETMGEAEVLYRHALALDPKLAIVYTNLGNLCFRMGREEEAEALYHQALGMDVHQPEAQYNLGFLLLERGRAREAVPYFRGAIAEDPQFADAHFNLAMAYEQVGSVSEARPCWKKYLELEPSGTLSEVARKHLG